MVGCATLTHPTQRRMPHFGTMPRERVGRGVIEAWSPTRTRRLVEPYPPLPGPLPQGEREPEVAVAVPVTMISTVLPLSECHSSNRPKRASYRDLAPENGSAAVCADHGRRRSAGWA